jgi:hypothetical protein
MLLTPSCSYTCSLLFLFERSDPSKVTSKTSLSSAPSTIKTNSGCSTLTVLSMKDRSELPTTRTEGEILSSSNLKAFTFSDLKNATRNFRLDSVLGEGGFGHVYKGWIDEHTLAPSRPGSGMVVAVKKLKPEGFQGHKEWLVGLSLFCTFFPWTFIMAPDGFFCYRQKSITLANFTTRTSLSLLVIAQMAITDFWCMNLCPKEV